MPDRANIVFGQPSFGPEEEELLIETLRSGWIGQGPLVQRFERALGAYLGAGEVVSVSSCTAALHLSLVAAGIGPGDEVVTTPFTFVATINAIEHAGATPVLVDVDRTTLSMTPQLAEAAVTSRTRAILPVHFGGRPLDTDGFAALAAKHDAWLVEDAAHAVGARRAGRLVGDVPDDRTLVCFSFYPNKNLASAEGGAVATRNVDVADRLRTLRLHGLDNDAWRRYRSDGYQPSMATFAGFKYNWTDVQAAIALPQLQKLEHFLAHRERLARHYDEVLADRADIELVPWRPQTPDVRNALHLYQVLVPAQHRDRIVDALRRGGIGAAVHYIGINHHPYYASRFAAQRFPVSDELSFATITLPLHVRMDEHDVERVAAALAAAVAESR